MNHLRRGGHTARRRRRTNFTGGGGTVVNGSGLRFLGGFWTFDDTFTGPFDGFIMTPDAGVTFEIDNTAVSGLTIVNSGGFLNVQYP